MRSITSKQLNILTCIYDAIEANGYPPTVREIGATVGLASTSTVHGHLSRLEKGGYISRDASKTRAIELTPVAFEVLGIQSDKIPLLGRVAAGEPILAIEEATEFYPVPPNLDHFDQNDLFMLEINGESMVNAGIFDGDLITVRRQPTAVNGEIVVAMTAEDEVTCKTFFKKDNHFILRPENDTMDDIVLDDVSIIGKVVALYREL